MEEIWKVLDIDNRYSVSNLGRVKSLAKGREYISQGWLDHNGYYCLRIKGELFSIHRLVAKYFIPTDNAQLHIDHIDGNKCNNRADNLRWVTQKENNNNPITRRRISESLKGGKRTPEQRLNMSIAQQRCKE